MGIASGRGRHETVLEVLAAPGQRYCLWPTTDAVRTPINWAFRVIEIPHARGGEASAVPDKKWRHRGWDENAGRRSGGEPPVPAKRAKRKENCPTSRT